MSIRAKATVAVLTLLLAATGCQDAPSPAEVPLDGPAFAKGGKKGGNNPAPSEGLAALGEAIFQDTNLSLNGDQSCETCHHPAMGFAGSLGEAETGFEVRGSVIEGSNPGHFGDRKPPTAAYATLMPVFHFSGKNATGGSFWDGRATGQTLGSPAAEQALGPFLAGPEQALANEACVLGIIQAATYGPEFERIFDVDLAGLDLGGACTSGVITDVILDQYANVGRAIAGFEETLNVFGSKFDAAQLSAQEARGAKLFSSSGKCQQCHDDKGDQPLFTDFEFHNLGVPKNPDNPVYHFGNSDFDPGLGAVTGEAGHLGKFKTPTVRNVAVGEFWPGRTYMHNGSLVTLWHVVQFYNTRDVLPVCEDPAVLADPAAWGPVTTSHPDQAGCWPAPEFGENLDTRNMGNLGLTDAEVNDVVAFMRALNDQELPGGGF